jgi:D-sedoheptulose 7-phosphate isomerase
LYRCAAAVWTQRIVRHIALFRRSRYGGPQIGGRGAESREWCSQEHRRFVEQIGSGEGIVRELLNRYFGTLEGALRDAEVTDLSGKKLPLEEGCDWVRRIAHEAHDAGNKIIFVGNGGSASIASHLAIDFSKNGKLRAMAFNDAAALTCLGNDVGYENVFATQIEFHARPGDFLVAISSSGRSPNVLAAVKAARQRGCKVATFSGFTDDNDLRRCGDVNFYVRAREYGFVEVAHLALCHAVLDIDMGWRPAA